MSGAEPARCVRAYSREEVTELLRSALGSIDTRSEISARLHRDLTDIANYIDSMRGELAELRSAEIRGTHIPAASDELDAVIGETAAATGVIMDACEKVENIAATVPAPAGPELSGIVTSIYEACTFQDITGQRINKVVKTLKSIESKVAEIVAAFGQAQAAVSSPQGSADGGLLHGPQLGGPATSQEEIDRLLASFDE